MPENFEVKMEPVWSMDSDDKPRYMLKLEIYEGGRLVLDRRCHTLADAIGWILDYAPTVYGDIFANNKIAIG